MPSQIPSQRRTQPVLAGIVAAIVGFASSFTIVLAGIHAVGADERQASSALLALSVSMALVGMWASWRYRLPVSIAWSTPGAALLVSSGVPDGGYTAALGAFALAGALTVLAGLWRPLERWIRAIPGPLASALLAGVLLPVCLSPAKGVVEQPRVVIPIVIAWAALMLVARRWAVPGALAAAIVAVAVAGPDTGSAFVASWPHITFDMPTWHLGALIGLGVPLFVVTMASQNVAGMAVLRSFGFDPPLRPLLVVTGATTAATSPLGTHGINLAALTAALVASPEADPEPKNRWIAGFASGASYLLLGLLAGVATSLVASAPPIVVSAVAGLALLGAMAGALSAAMADATTRDAAIITLVTAASGISAFGVSAPFWGLAAGVVYHVAGTAVGGGLGRRSSRR